ncbi:MAG: type I-E CRISPR-associated protein Cas6/Cse3/CasE [Candidatus Kapabacteria bacterium]|nr:type I-E CRISPR-associated protein Cas6/Cse3/CasE [Candidatus Kapabacteria bacterium]
MNLSKLTLNLKNRQVRNEINSPYELHRTLTKAFVLNGVLEENRILFRIESAKKMGFSAGKEVLVQSRTVEPDWRNLSIPDDYFLSPPQTKQIDLTKLDSGFYQFKLIANPTVKKNGRRVGLYSEDEHNEWLKRKGTQHGFEPVYINCSDFEIGSKTKTEDPKNELKKSDIYHIGVTFEGILKIIDSGKVISSLHSGIGSAKAFGFGLLTIARVG